MWFILPYDLSVGGVSVKTCIIALRRFTFLKENQIHHIIKFSFLFGLTYSLSQFDIDSIQIKIKMN